MNLGEINYTQLASKLTKALECAIPDILKKVGEDSLMAFGLYVSEELNYISFTASPVVDKPSVPSAWSPPDWSLHLYKQDCLQDVENELFVGWNEDYSDFIVDRQQLVEIYVSALRQARDRFFRGSNIVVGIFMGGMSDPVVISSVRRINPPDVANFFITAITP